MDFENSIKKIKITPACGTIIPLPLRLDTAGLHIFPILFSYCSSFFVIVIIIGFLFFFILLKNINLCVCLYVCVRVYKLNALDNWNMTVWKMMLLSVIWRGRWRIWCRWCSVVGVSVKKRRRFEFEFVNFRISFFFLFLQFYCLTFHIQVVLSL